MQLFGVAIAGSVLVVAAIAWRLVARSRARSALVRALSDPQEAVRAAAVDVVAAGGVSRFARVLWEQAQTETSAVVLDRIVEAVVRNQWEPADNSALVRLRLWARQRLEMEPGEGAPIGPGPGEELGPGEEMGAANDLGAGEGLGAVGSLGSGDAVSYHLARLEALVAEVSEANWAGTPVSCGSGQPGTLGGKDSDEASVEGSLPNAGTAEARAMSAGHPEVGFRPGPLAKAEDGVAEIEQGVEEGPAQTESEEGIDKGLGEPSRSDLVRFLRCYTNSELEPATIAPAEVPATVPEGLAGLVGRAR